MTPFRIATFALAFSLFAGGVTPIGAAAAAEAPSPGPWPASPGVSPGIEGSAHALRIFGADRYSTNLALALTLRGTGDFPFSTPDRSSGGASSLAGAGDWWGVGRCPRAVIVVAGDSPADALAASALSDPTGSSSEPYLQRSASADPSFDPVGGFARVDTDQAPILVTRSARQGAQTLSPATRVAAEDLRSGGCDLARQAIVVGGSAAVPAGVEAELLALGYREVFRVAGPSRYATAAAVARSLGTAEVPTGTAACGDVSVADGGARMAFYANSVVELRDSATTCRLLGRTVVLADGVTGADALAAGWWTSFWQVPVLLHDGSSRLPASTVEALDALDVQNLVVLGGGSRVPSGVVAEAEALTGAASVRVAGPDRYATSVEMARRFGGWWPTGRGAEFEASLVCLAASSGDGAGARGWPDALGAGPWCGAANGAAANPGMPRRALAPTTGGSPALSSSALERPAHDAVPVLLVPAGAESLPSVVAGLLTDAFPAADGWCSSSSTAAPVCRQGGFVVGFGGGAVLGAGALGQASRLVSGLASLDPGDETVRLDPVFSTRLDPSGVFDVLGSGPERVCAERDGYAGARWIAAFDAGDPARLVAAGDVMLAGRYVRDADGVVRSPGLGAPVCVALAPPAAAHVELRGVGLSGRVSAPRPLDLGVANRFDLAGPITWAGPYSFSGLASDTDPASGGTTTWTYHQSGLAVGVVSRGQLATITSAAITIRLERGGGVGGVVGPDRFSASWSMDTSAGAISGTATGEAVLSAGTWRLFGRSGFSGGSWNFASGTGGFTAEIATASAGSSSDDAITWRLDGQVGN